MQLHSAVKCFTLLLAVFILCVSGLGLSNSMAVEKLNEDLNERLAIKFTGDYPEMQKRRAIRVLVPYSKTFYFLDGAEQKGVTYEILKEFEKFMNKELQTKHLKMHLVIVPTTRDRLIPGLVEGLGDIAAGNLTITENRLKDVDFADPVAKGVDEIVVTSKEGDTVKTLDDLSGKSIHVRKSSSYYESLTRLNQKFKKESKAPIDIVLASKYFEDEDLLEMVNAGLIPMVVVDNFKANFWAKIFPDIVLHNDIKVNTGGEIAWAIRKNCPELEKVINRFVKGHKKGTLFGNVIFNRYFKDTTFAKNSLAEKDRERFTKTMELFKKYGEQYNFDWLMLAALAYQESTIDQSKRSHAGAIGVMQILPSTAKDKNVGIPGIEKIEPNIHAGTKYIRFMVDRYFDDPQMDDLNKGLFAFASYNAGPAKVAKLRKEAAKSGLDPNVWFRNVEVIAAKRIGRETVQYVSNIFKYYTAYKLLQTQYKMKKVVKEVHTN